MGGWVGGCTWLTRSREEEEEEEEEEEGSSRCRLCSGW